MKQQEELSVGDEETCGRGRRKLNSRRKLLDAASKLFVERGYHDTRPQDVSKEAGVGHGTFYLHFADKRQCYLAFVAEAREGLQAEILKYSSDQDDFEARVLATLKGTLDYSSQHPLVLTAAMSNSDVIGAGEEGQRSLVDIWAENWAHQLNLAKEKGKVRPDIDSMIIAHSIIGIFSGSVTYAANNPDLSHDLVIENVSQFVLRALRP